jgi:hypothetical protein
MVIYDISPARMHLRGTQKTPTVAERRYLRRADTVSRIKVIEPDLQSARGRISSLKLGNYRSFLDIYDLVGRSSAPFGDQAPGGGMSHER